METIFMKTENIRTNDSNKFFYQFTDKLNLENPNRSIFYTWKTIKSEYNNNRFKIHAPA